MEREVLAESVDVYVCEQHPAIKGQRITCQEISLETAVGSMVADTLPFISLGPERIWICPRCGFPIAWVNSEWICELQRCSGCQTPWAVETLICRIVDFWWEITR